MRKIMMIVLCLDGMGIAALSQYDGGDYWFDIYSPTGFHNVAAESFKTDIPNYSVSSISLRLQENKTFMMCILNIFPSGMPAEQLLMGWQQFEYQGEGGWQTFDVGGAIAPAGTFSVLIMCYDDNDHIYIAHDITPDSGPICYSWRYVQQTDTWYQYNQTGQGDFAIVINSGDPVETTTLGNIKASYH